MSQHENIAYALLAQLDRATSCPLRKALIMLFRGEMSKRINHAFAVTERKENRTLREKGVRTNTRATLRFTPLLEVFAYSI